ncbi:MAG: hypothetical protein WC071_13620 [Victivallaceae bacterium]
MDAKWEAILTGSKDAIMLLLEHNLKYEKAIFLPEKAIVDVIGKNIPAMKIKNLECSAAGVEATLSVSKVITLGATVKLQIQQLTWDGKKLTVAAKVEDIAGDGLLSKSLNFFASKVTSAFGTSPIGMLIKKVNAPGLTFRDNVIYYEWEHSPLPEVLQVSGAEHKPGGIMVKLI